MTGWNAEDFSTGGGPVFPIARRFENIFSGSERRW